jgi:hypothetical protein
MSVQLTQAMIDRYVIDKLTMAALAAETGMSQYMVRERLKKLGLIRAPGKATGKEKNHNSNRSSYVDIVEANESRVSKMAHDLFRVPIK